MSNLMAPSSSSKRATGTCTLMLINEQMHTLFDKAHRRVELLKHRRHSRKHLKTSTKFEGAIVRSVSFEIFKDVISIERNIAMGHTASSVARSSQSFTRRTDASKEERKRDIARRKQQEFAERLRRLEKYLVKFFASSNKKRSTGMRGSAEKFGLGKSSRKKENEVHMDILYNFAIEERDLEGNTDESRDFADRTSSHVHLNLSGNKSTFLDIVLCRSTNTKSTFYQRFCWHMSLWSCVTLLFLFATIFLAIFVYSEYGSTLFDLVSDVFNGNLSIEDE
eukprot:g4767.t1